MQFSLLFSLGALAAVSAAPSSPLVLEARQTGTLCDQYAYWSGNGYELLNNLWGKDAATSGSQCVTLDGTTNAGLAWRTNWTWSGGPESVKSFVYAGKQFPKGRTIQSISSMHTSVSWRYSTEKLRANVAYDMFTAADPNHANSFGDYEVMIWLARLNNAKPIGGDMGIRSIGGRSYNLWVGYNGAMKVFSFVAVGNQYDWSGDAKLFFDYLKDNERYPADSQNLIVYQFGTEAFVGGPATMTVSQFAANVN
ncbi:glycoside hydrolase family 12 protein [Cladorrhinum sp. PSN259]|nr:glycoside hydrolase family 12 protein [Cladorrhinum sp. PSN259]